MGKLQRGLNRKDEPSISKIERVTAIFVGQGMTKSHFLQIFNCQYLVEILRYGSNFFACDNNFYRFQKNFKQHKVSRPSFIYFQEVALSAPPPRVFDPPSDVGFKRVKVLLDFGNNPKFLLILEF